MNKYDEYKQSWEDFRFQFPPCGHEKREAHSVTAKDLISELAKLKRMTGDVRFREAVTALQDHGLLDTNGSWIRYWKKSSDLDREKMYANAVNNAMIRNRSLREAAAYIALDLQLENASFDGAVEYLERQWRKHIAPSLDNK